MEISYMSSLANKLCALNLYILVLTTYNINLSVGVSHVANDAATFHFIHVLPGHYIFVPSGCHDYINITDHFIQFYDSETIHTAKQKKIS